GSKHMNRRQAREEAFKILFEQYINTQELDIHAKTDDTYIINVVTGVLKEQEKIDEKIKQHLKNWTFERIAPVEKAILRLSVYEILFVESIPIAVSINEDVELAHAYGDDKSSKFINGVLSNMKERRANDECKNYQR